MFADLHEDKPFLVGGASHAHQDEASRPTGSSPPVSVNLANPEDSSLQVETSSSSSDAENTDSREPSAINVFAFLS